jgi:hypothetical protein
MRFLAFVSILVTAMMVSGCATTSPATFSIGLVGDAPYLPAHDALMDQVVRDMNGHDLDFVIHVGDLQIGAPGRAEARPPCNDDALLHAMNILGRSRAPVIITPGDNDWTDCHEMVPPVDPLQRLERLRDLLYRDSRYLPAPALGISAQSPASYPEHLRWERNGVLFLTLHIVGSNNNTGRVPEADAESAARTAAAIVWLRESFALARERKSKAVMIVIHANPYFEDRWPPFYVRLVRVAPRTDGASAFQQLLAALEEEASAFKLPVALVHGDSHYFRVDKPLFRAGDGKLVPNFTRVESFGAPYVHWVKITVDPGSAAVFTFSPQMGR